MTTSALALQQLLAVANSHKNDKEKFTIVLANHLGLSGRQAQIKVASIISNLIAEARNDIDELYLEDNLKNHLMNHISPFVQLENLAHFHLDIANAKNNFLKSDNIVGLSNVHLALLGFADRAVLDYQDSQKLAIQFRNLAEKIKTGEDFPESLRRSLIKRCLQIASALEHYYAFGAEEIQEGLEGLVGAMVINPPQAGSSLVHLYSQMAKAAVVGLGLLAAVDSGLAKSISIMENASKLIDVVDEHIADDEKNEEG